MSIKENLEQDIVRFFKDIEDQLPENKKKTLILLFDKYMHLSTTPMLWDNSDFQQIKGIAIKLHNDRNFPKTLGKFSTIGGAEISQICLVEATISHANSKDCLKKMPKFDYKE